MLSKLRRTQAGVMVFTDIETGAKTEIPMHRCCHCQKNFPIDPKTSYWCGQCAGHVCGEKCVDAVPWEQELENIEKGRPENWKPIIG